MKVRRVDNQSTRAHSRISLHPEQVSGFSESYYTLLRTRWGPLQDSPAPRSAAHCRHGFHEVLAFRPGGGVCRHPAVVKDHSSLGSDIAAIPATQRLQCLILRRLPALSSTVGIVTYIP